MRSKISSIANFFSAFFIFKLIFFKTIYKFFCKIFLQLFKIFFVKILFFGMFLQQIAQSFINLLFE